MGAPHLEWEKRVVGEGEDGFQIAVRLRGVADKQSSRARSQPEEVNVIHELVGLLTKQERVKGH